ncbi:MAG TPA: LysR family transcriptional regulator [Bosea sp. (in: a-proteobacteria)]|nr:MAG: hypothetical protein DI537_32655 [Stutzerimonas stutzeri]HEV7327838.1 LysR family transcriptional regulator [Bosea sp. (in: a-proteobacteria)]
MNTRYLHHFCRAAELNSISAVAVEAKLAQPVVSRQIRAIEEELGLQLFIRDGRGVHLTDAGTIFYSHIKEALQKVEEAADLARNSNAELRGRVRIGVPPSHCQTFIPAFIDNIGQTYPHIEVSFYEGFSLNIAEWLQGGRIDIGILYTTQKYGFLNCELRLEEGLFAVTPSLWAGADKSISIAQLAGRPLIAHAPPSTARSAVEKIASNDGVRLDFAQQIDSLIAIKELVALGRGIGLLPRAAIASELRCGILQAVPLEPERLNLSLSLAVPNNGTRNLVFKAALAICKSTIADLVASGEWAAKFVPVGDKP